MKLEKLDLSRILKDFGSRLIGDDRSKKIICETLLLFPRAVVDYITRNVWFITPFDDAWSFTLEADGLASKSLVFLSDDLLRQDDDQIRYSIAHEIAHIMLGHRNPYGVIIRKGSDKRSETDADEFARYYLESPKVS